MAEGRASPRKRWHPALHLIWALPIALIVSWFLGFWATLTWCGISGCSGAGFGLISDPNIPAAVAMLIGSGAVVALPVGIVHWTPKKRTRWLVAVALFILITGGGYASMQL